MRVKILHAWCLGLPIVSTTIGAEGIHYQDGQDLIIADDAATFAEQVVRLLCESKSAGEIGRAGRKTVERHYDWRRAYPAWDVVYGTAPE
jgi:glycosyltransferase involved in cell wall biosynthesis